MRNLPLLVTAMLLGGRLNAQDILRNYDFSQFDSVACASDTTRNILKPLYWDIYQTENDLWDGPRIEGCIIASEGRFSRLTIARENFDIGKTLFLRYMATEKVVLERNSIYGLRMQAWGRWDFAGNCSRRTCSGYTIGLGVPDSIGDGRMTRDYWLPMHDESNYRSERCFGTERFDSITLDTFIVQFRFDPDAFLDESISFRTCIFERTRIQTHLTSIEIGDEFYRDSAYLVESYQLGNGHGSQLVLYNDPNKYPSPEAIYYLDANLINNVPTRQTINISVFGALVFQPFTQIRGGLTSNSDTLRHQANIILEHGEFCIHPFLDLTFEHGNHFIFKGGAISCGGDLSCMQFSRGSRLQVAEGADLHLGHNGQGMLALRTGGSIELAKNSSLTLDLRMEMHELSHDSDAQIVHARLAPGATLRFTEHCRVSNELSRDRTMHLLVELNGGEVDLSHLSADERALIRIAEECVTPPSVGEFEVYPNPFSDHLTIRINEEQPHDRRFFLYDVQGDLVISKSLTVSDTEVEMATSHLPQGIYLMQLRGRTTTTFKLVRR